MRFYPFDLNSVNVTGMALLRSGLSNVVNGTNVVVRFEEVVDGSGDLSFIWKTCKE